MNLVFPEGANTGEMSLGNLNELKKALTAGYGSDVSTLTGGGALRIQSLENTMLATIQQHQHFKLFNKLQKTDAIATVDEWTEQNGVGGFMGGSTNTETGVINATQGSYNRRVGLVKYLMTRRQVSFVTTLQSALADAESVEQQAGSLELLTDAEYLCFEGDSTIVPTEFDGIAAQIESLGSADHVVDAEAKSLNSVNLVSDAAAVIAARDNFGTPTDLFMSNLTQSDFDKGLDPAFRVALDNTPNSVAIGTPVVGIRTSWGNIATNADVFIRDGEHMKPFEVEQPALATANDATIKPVSFTAVAGAGGADSKWGAPHAGNYFYLVTGVSAKGQSTGVIGAAAVAVAAGQQVTVTITRNATIGETGYVVYRSKLNQGAGPAAGDFRQMARVAYSGNPTTVYIDKNRDIPGTSKAYVLNNTPGAKAISWRQLLPMIKFPLYPTDSAVVPWAQLLFGFLRIGKRRQHVVIKNVLPNGASWRPFN